MIISCRDAFLTKVTKILRWFPKSYKPAKSQRRSLCPQGAPSPQRSPSVVLMSVWEPEMQRRRQSSGRWEVHPSIEETSPDPLLVPQPHPSVLVLRAGTVFCLRPLGLVKLRGQTAAASKWWGQQYVLPAHVVRSLCVGGRSSLPAVT